MHSFLSTEIRISTSTNTYKYNNYYLAKTLITAHNDIELLGSISEKMQEKYKELYNLVYNIMKNDREDIEELFNAEQKKAIKNLIKI